MVHSATIICVFLYHQCIGSHIYLFRVMYLIAPMSTTTRRIREVSHITILHDVALYVCPNIVAYVSISDPQYLYPWFCDDWCQKEFLGNHYRRALDMFYGNKHGHPASRGMRESGCLQPSAALLSNQGNIDQWRAEIAPTHATGVWSQRSK